MIRPSHKSTKRKKSPQRVLGQRAGGAGGGAGRRRRGSWLCLRLRAPRGQQHREVRDRRDAAPAHGDACRVRTVSTRSLCAFRGRTVRAGTGGTGSRPSGLGAPGNHAGRCAGDPGSEGSQCQGRAVPCPTPPPPREGGGARAAPLGASRHCARARCPRPGAASGVRQSGQSGGRHCPRTGRRQRPRPGGRAGDRKGFHPLSLPSKANPRGFPISANVTKQVATLVSSEGAQGRADRRG